MEVPCFVEYGSEVFLPEFLAALLGQRGHTDKACATLGVGEILVGPFPQGCL